MILERGFGLCVLGMASPIRPYSNRKAPTSACLPTLAAVSSGQTGSLAGVRLFGVSHLRVGYGGEGAPVVADGAVPEQPLLPDLEEQPSVQVPHLAGPGGHC